MEHAWVVSCHWRNSVQGWSHRAGGRQSPVSGPNHILDGFSVINPGDLDRPRRTQGSLDVGRTSRTERQPTSSPRLKPPPYTDYVFPTEPDTFVAFGEYEGFGVVDFPPIAAVDLDRPIDVDALAATLLGELVGDESASMLLRSRTSRGVLELPGHAQVDADLHAVASELARLDIGLADCRLDVRTHANSWATGHGAQIEFRTESSGDRWISFEALSGAQQYWFCAALHLGGARAYGARSCSWRMSPTVGFTSAPQPPCSTSSATPASQRL